jgi:osmoprotectant transport system permease protein
MSEELRLLPELLSAHVQLTIAALVLGMLLSVPLGIVIARTGRGERMVLGAASVVQTVPALALLAIMVPALAALGALTARTFGVAISSIGYPPALIALTLYSVLPMLRNTVAGLRGVDASLLEAARGVGMTTAEQLRLVQVPLALPVIVAGIRTATVWVVGMATLSTPVGAPSLGNYIFSGLQTRNFRAVLVGCIAAAGLALALDALARAIERGLRERRPVLLRGALAVAAALLVYAGAALAWPTRDATGAIRVGAKTFTEQYILGELLARRIEGATGRPAQVLPSLGSTVAFDALASGSIDVYVDYSGTIWATVMGRSDVPPRETVLAEVGRWLAGEHGITLVGALGFENAYALAMRGADARARGIATISQLAPHASAMQIAGDYEFFVRPEWRSLVRTYGLGFRAQRTMDPSLMYEAIAGGEVEVISAFSTDGRISALDLAVLDDDRRAVPPYDAIMLASARLARDAPDVIAALRPLAGAIDADRMRRLNHAVDAEGRSPAQVAAELLDALSLDRAGG